MTRATKVVFCLSSCLLLLFPVGLLLGNVAMSPAEVWSAFNSSDEIGHFIVVETRLPALITSMLAGASLAVAGLMMQTCFGNPLAGPSIMGISNGSSLGVALVVMLFGGVVGIWGNMAIVAGALAGALLVMLVLLGFSTFVHSSEALLIVGILIGYLVSSAISLLNYFSTSQAVHSFVLWGLGTFSSVDLSTMPIFACLCVLLIAAAMMYCKTLNVMLFGVDYARSVGISAGRARSGILMISGALTAAVTAYCGPIGFIGLVVPHISRMLLDSSNHYIIMPITALAGALTGLICQELSVAPAMSFVGSLPINAITPVIGVPVILYVMLNRRKLSYFN